jgi:hypothetical protein
VEGWLEEVSRKLNQANVSDHNAGFGPVRGLLSSKTCKPNQAGRICKLEGLVFRRSLGPWLPKAHVEYGRCQEVASARSKCCKCNIAQISVLWRYSLGAFKIRYKKPRSEDGAKFAGDW